ncbi:MAG: acylphosphatase [Calditrichaeota bacterium]|nr:acylphosphatase [Calditrichota bacterium]
MKKALHIIIKGRVQGVGYRWFVRERARDHGISGYVRNLPNGDVEVLAQGEEEKLNLFITELNRGPAFAHVIDMEIDEVALNETRYRSFEIAF